MNSNTGGGLSRPRLGGTPTNTAGKFRPPTAPVSSGARARRVTTPRSASRGKGGGTVTLPPKPKLTAEQQLDIIQRLRSGHFKKGVGVSQFYEEFGSNNNAAVNGSGNTSKMTCKQNLFASFASVDNHQPLASSTRNYGRVGSVESLLSMSSSVVSSAHSHSTTLTEAEGDVTLTTLDLGQEPRALAVELEGDSTLSYIATFDKLIQGIKLYYHSLERLSQVQCQARFAKLLPKQKMVSFFKSLSRTQKIIRRFLNGNASENLKMFMPAPIPKGSKPKPSMQCDVERHAEVVQAFYKLSEILDKLDMFLKQGDDVDFKLEAKLDSFKESVDKLETTIQTQEKCSVHLHDLIKKTEILQLADDSAHWESQQKLADESPY